MEHLSDLTNVYYIHPSENPTTIIFLDLFYFQRNPKNMHILVKRYSIY